VRRLPAWLLKGSAVCLTVLATVGSAAFVGGHVKNQSAPLRPSLEPPGGQVNLAPGMRTTGSEPVTETHAS
jgi:hypothetical protein